MTIGVVFDLSGSMNSKFQRARKRIEWSFFEHRILLDEFFVVGFERPSCGDCGLHLGRG